jgi:hypothetical protein
MISKWFIKETKVAVRFLDIRREDFVDNAELSAKAPDRKLFECSGRCRLDLSPDSLDHRCNEKNREKLRATKSTQPLNFAQFRSLKKTPTEW